MHNLILNENLKIYKRTGTLVMMFLLLAIIITVGIVTKFVFSDSQTDDWKATLQAETTQLQQDIDTGSYPKTAINYMEKEIAINEYRLSHDIPPTESQTLWGFMITSSDITILVSLFTIVVGAGIVASEFSWGTIKLLLIRPVSRSKILLSKFLATMLFALLSLFLLFTFSFIVGSILYGFDGLTLPYLAYTEGKVVEQNMLTYILTLYGLKSVNLVMMVTFAFMISTVFRSSSLSIGLAIFLMFTGSQIVQIFSRYDWVKYILFANTDLSQYINGTPIVEGMTITFSITILVIYFLLFTGLSWYIFNKRDVAA
ncbi:ABC transporter permease [Bacillus salitolerans]|uniref:ABC transporter permease n=1 Tax=Bacillus salitolerans TaxID=1437434 RepID=A0ABW4LNR2_9BACI